MKKIIALFVISIGTIIGASAETPVEGMQAIIKLYETKNFDKLIRERYTEIYKAKSENEVKKVIEMVEKRFSSPKRLQRLIDVYKQAASVKPVISKDDKPQQTETGEMAKFKLGKGAIKLYKMKTGKWGFHM